MQTRYCEENSVRPSVCHTREWVSSFLTAHQHIIGYSVPYNGNDDDFYRSYDQTNSVKALKGTSWSFR